MPLYEYKCERCGDVFEVIQKFSDEPVKVHEKCGGAVERLVSRSAFQLKGSGWYATDYAKGNGSTKTESSGAKNTSESGGKSAETKSSETKSSETKSETKTDSPSSSSSSTSSKTKSE